MEGGMSMQDREKVIGHLNDCMEASRRDNTWVFVRKDIVEDSIAMLKEQETTRWKKISPAGIYECEKCGKHIISQDIECFKYCFNCGRPVK